MQSPGIGPLDRQTVTRLKKKARATKNKGADPVSDEQYAKVWRTASTADRESTIEECTGMINILETHLGDKQRHDRAKQMSINLRTRAERFQDKDKTMLKTIINSIMQI